MLWNAGWGESGCDVVLVLEFAGHLHGTELTMFLCYSLRNESILNEVQHALCVQLVHELTYS